ncbi:MAG: sialate O-acetylesterase, partial [Planctomycetota bacterium]|nr:sialate O-acetylesterase [Planctomycetota bacterium]
MRYTFSTFTAWALCVTPQTLAAQDPAGIVPAVLPRPADKAGDVRKPVQVYILAGQSNMVGMGDIGGARPLYPSVFLSADPRIVPGRMPVGSSALNTLQIFQAAAANASRGATATIFPGAYDPGTDYDKRSPARLAPVTLGAVGGKLPAVDGPHTLVVTAFVQVPTTGRYQVHAGFGRSSHSVVTLDGKEIYRKDVGSSAVINTVTLEKGKRYPVKVTYLQGGSASFWMEQVEIKGQGDLETVTKVDKKFPYLIGEDGSWTVRNDVYFQEARIAKDGKGSPLSATSNGRSIGPEVGFGYVMGTFHEEQVLLIKTAMGNRALGWDFRPPSSGKSDKADADKWEGLEYRLMVEGVRKTLAKLDKIVPGYQGQGYEIAGFAWFQGHKDGGMEGLADEYEQNLVNLIQDVRKEFKAPKMPAVVATVGFGGYRMSDKYIKIWNAQMAVGDPRKHPEFAGTVTSVDIRDFWREVEESPRSQDYHYNRNAESYMLIGEAIGRAMVRLRGGEAAPMPRSGRDVAPIPAPPTKPTEIAKTASLAATVPLVLDGVLATYTSNPRNQGFLQAILMGQGPKRATQVLGDAMDEVTNHYRVLGIHDYDWHVFGPD